MLAIAALPQYDEENEQQYREDVRRRLEKTYKRNGNVIVPYGYQLGFTGEDGSEAAFKYDSGVLQIVINGVTVVGFATDSSVITLSARVDDAEEAIVTAEGQITTIDGKLTGSYGLTVDVNGRIAQMKLLSNGTTSSVKFLATTFSVYNGSTDEAPFVVEGGVVKAKKVAADSVTATEIDVASLDAISATIGLLRTASTGARMELESNQGRVYDSSNVLRVRWGIWT